MSAQFRKIIGDLQEHPWRTFLVVMALLVGSVAVAATFGARAILLREVVSSYEGSRPMAATLWFQSVDRHLLELARTYPGVTGADGRRLVRARVEIAPGEWRPLLIFAIADFHNLHVSTIHLHAGAWPPPVGTLLIEQSALPVLRWQQDASLSVTTAGGQVRRVSVSGIVHDPGLAPGWMENVGYAYALPATLALLGQGSQLTELRITVQDGRREEAARVAAGLAGWLGAQGYRASAVDVGVRKHFHEDQIQVMLTLLQLLSLFTLVLSSVLTMSLIAALLGRQVREIAIMKTLGATSKQIMRLYLILVLLLSAAAVVVGVPVGALVARGFAGRVAAQLNLEVSSRAIPPSLLAVEALICIAVPLISALLPIVWRGRMTAREALQHDSRDLLAQGPWWRGRAIEKLLPDLTVILAIRNAARYPVRLLLTLVALTVGGAALMTSVNVFRSLIRSADAALEAEGTDVGAQLIQPAPQAALRQEVQRIPSVRSIELWGHALASIEFSGSTSDAVVGTGRYNLFAPSANARLLRQAIHDGRWPRQGESGAVVLNSSLQERERDLKLDVGSKVTLLIRGRRTPVRVVGIYSDLGEPAMYTTPEELGGATGLDGTVGAIRLATAPGQERQVALALESRLMKAGWVPNLLVTRSIVRTTMIHHFLPLMVVLITAALSAVAIGGLGLATMMSISVLEQTREIGVMRAIGAPQSVVLRILVTEGLAVATVSMALAIALSIPLSSAVARLIGDIGLHFPVKLHVSWIGVAGWVCLAGLVSLMACLWPARYAVRRTVCAALAHE